MPIRKLKLAAIVSCFVLASCSLNSNNPASSTTPVSTPPSTVPPTGVPPTAVALSGDIGFVQSAVTVEQSSGTAQLTVARKFGSSGAVAVKYSTVNYSAVAGTHYQATSGTLKWADGDSRNKSVSVPISSAHLFRGTKAFAVALSAPSGGAKVVAANSSTVSIVGMAPIPGPTVSKSIRNWAACDGTTDYTRSVAEALRQAANHSFRLVVDCVARIHFTGGAPRTITIEDGTEIEFTGAGEFKVDYVSPAAFIVKHPTEVTFINWNAQYPTA